MWIAHSAHYCHHHHYCCVASCLARNDESLVMKIKDKESTLTELNRFFVDYFLCSFALLD